MNKVYYLYRLEDVGLDEYDGQVVLASCNDEARKLANINYGGEGQIWCDPSQVACDEIKGHECPGVICASFNAG